MRHFATALVAGMPVLRMLEAVGAATEHFNGDDLLGGAPVEAEIQDKNLVSKQVTPYTDIGYYASKM